MEPAIEQVAREMPEFGKPSYFEAQFALSCLWFAEQNVDVAVVEVGLGGRLDGTNVLPASVAVITNIGLDHTEILGDTVELIAVEKAGIIKQNQVVVTGASQPSVLQIIRERSHSFGIPCWELDRDFMVIEGEDAFHLNLFGREVNHLTLPLRGLFQQTNAAVATAAALAFAGQHLTAETIRNGLSNIPQFPGRLEQVQVAPEVVLDGAHNPSKIEASRQAMESDARTIVVMAIKSGKNLEDMMYEVVEVADALITTQFYPAGLWEPYSAESIAEMARFENPDLPIWVIADPLEGLEKALEMASPTDRIWVTGSLYLVGDVRGHWYPPEQLLLDIESDNDE